MPYIFTKFPMTGGLETTKSNLSSSINSFAQMYNWRQSPHKLGQVETTPRFYAYKTQAPGVGWNGTSSVTDYGAPRFWDVKTSFMMAQCCAYNVSTSAQIPVVEQITIPTTSGVTGGCLLTMLTPYSYMAFVDKFQVKIDSTNSFVWRLNSGSWSSSITIDQINGNVVGTGYIRLDWLASTGFTINDLWVWQRTDLASQQSVITSFNLIQVNDSYFYVGNGGKIFEAVISGGVVVYIRSVGYRWVIGTNLFIYENHLFVLNGQQVFNSDRANLHNFVPTDTNEADVFDLPLNQVTTPQTGLIAVAGVVFQSRLYILTNVGIFYTDYAGLPVPFNIKFLKPLIGGLYMVVTSNIIYIASQYFLYTFDGVNLTTVYDFYSDYDVNTRVQGLQELCWNPITNELIIHGGMNYLVLQLNFGTFYKRAAGFNNNSISKLNIDQYGGIQTCAPDLVCVLEDTAQVFQPISDSGVPATPFAAPVLMFQYIGGNDMHIVKEGQMSFAAAYVYGQFDTYYSIGTDNTLVLMAAVSSNGKDTYTTDIDTWSSSTVDYLKNTRYTYRAISLGFRNVGLVSGKPPGKITLTFFGTFMYEATAQR